MKISAALKALIDNPDDLTSLPQLVAQVEALEASEEDYQTRIANLQDINKKYLAQIPIAGKDESEPPAEEEPTLEDAKEYLVGYLKGE